MCQGITRSHPDCSHTKSFLIMEPCNAYKVDRCATYPTFDHNGITVHCGFCQLGVHETILREYPRFPRKCPECLTDEEDKLRGAAEACIAGYENTIQEISAESWKDEEWKDDEWRDIIINGYEMLIAQRFRSLSDDLEDLWEVSYGVETDVPDDAPSEHAPITPPDSPAGSPPPVPPHTTVSVPGNVPSNGENDAQGGEGESNESNDTPFEFERVLVTPPTSLVSSPPGAPPNTPVTFLSIAPPSTPMTSPQPVPLETPVEVPSAAPSDIGKDVWVEGAEKSHDAEDDLECTQVTVVRHEIRHEEEVHEAEDDPNSSQVTVSRDTEEKICLCPFCWKVKSMNRTVASKG
jgi:hypothetical protein